MFPQIFGKYVLERELSSGGMAVVYLATLRGAGGFEKRLVVKQIRSELASDEAFVQRFVAEAKTTVELSHANIVPVYELGVEQGVYFIAMELALGVTLSELLRATGPLTPEEGAHLGVEICRALDYAHRKAGIVHRDVTPRNVIIDEEGAVRVIDFGIAAPVTAEGASHERVFGSPGHMPREQLEGGRLTPATDVFAVGALLVEAWTGRAPFRRATARESEAALDTPPPRLSETVPELAALDDLLARATASDPAARPQTAEDLARPLRDFLRPHDLGDIARRLGGRVKKARRNSRPEASGDAIPATPQVGGAEDRGDRLAAGTPVTPLGSLVTPADVPPAPVAAPVTASVTRPISASRTQTFATRGEIVEWTRGSTAPGPNPSNGLATAPVGRRRAGVAVSAVLAIAVLLVLVSRRMSVPGPPAPAPVPTVTAPPPPLPVESAPAMAPRAEVPAPSAASSAADSVEAFALASFTSDLPARVTLDGAPHGTTPLRGLRTSPGRHQVVIASVELDEHLTTTIVARAGEAISIHAEFTKPVPALRVRTGSSR